MEWDQSALYRELVASPEGRAHALSLAVYAEEGDEGAIFDQLMERIEEPKLNRLVRRHRDDEIRHAELFRERLDRLGLDLQPLPDELRLIRYLAEKVGGFAVALDTADDNMISGIYALLLAVEERGVATFPVIADAFQLVDSETAETYRRVTEDEKRHTRYCRAIGKRYAGCEEAWRTIVGATRMIEAEAFAEFYAANVAYCVTEGLVGAGAPEWPAPDRSAP